MIAGAHGPLARACRAGDARFVRCYLAGYFRIPFRKKDIREIVREARWVSWTCDGDAMVWLRRRLVGRRLLGGPGCPSRRRPDIRGHKVGIFHVGFVSLEEDEAMLARLRRPDRTPLPEHLRPARSSFVTSTDYLRPIDRTAGRVTNFPEYRR